RVGLLRGGQVAVAGLEYPGNTGSDTLVVLSVVLREMPDAAGYRYERVAATPTVIPRSTTGVQPPLVFGPIHAMTAHHDRMCLGHTAEYRITCFDAAGATAFRLMRATSPATITAELRTFARSAYVDGNRSPGLSREQLLRVEAEAQR